MKPTEKESGSKSTVTALLAAFIWGTAFVAQKKNTMGALTFNASRSIVGAVFLLLVILVMTKGDVKHILSEPDKKDTKNLWKGGGLCGISLAAATFFQQYGMDKGVEAGKAGFLTSLYMVLVAIASRLMGKKGGWRLYVSIGVSLIGLYFLSFKAGLTFRLIDGFILLAALLFCFQILFIDHYSVKCNCIKMSCIQFLTSFVLSAAGALLFETFTGELLRENLLPVLYLGIFSSGVAYTLQMIAQKGSNPALVSILLSMESVFSVLSSAVILKERLTIREYIGCVIVLLAVVFTQIGPKKKEKTAV